MLTPDTEIALRHGRHRAIVSPYGASLRRYEVGNDGADIEVLWGYSGSKNKRGGQGDVLIPFPGRVARGRYEFQGRSYQLDCNDKEGPNAIHGFVRTMMWEITENESGHAEFETRLNAADLGPHGYPFSLNVRIRYELTAEGLSCGFAVENIGDTDAPLGIGFHPYFTVGTGRLDDAELTLPATHVLEFSPTLVPTGRIITVADAEMDYREPRRLETTRLNHCFIGLIRDGGGLCHVRLRNPWTGRTVTVQMDRSFSAVVVYSGDAIADAPRQALAIEPMTCASDAFNHPAWGLTVLQPAQRVDGRYSIIPG